MTSPLLTAQLVRPRVRIPLIALENLPSGPNVSLSIKNAIVLLTSVMIVATRRSSPSQLDPEPQIPAVNRVVKLLYLPLGTLTHIVLGVVSRLAIALRSALTQQILPPHRKNARYLYNMATNIAARTASSYRSDTPPTSHSSSLHIFY